MAVSLPFSDASPYTTVAHLAIDHSFPAKYGMPYLMLFEGLHKKLLNSPAQPA